METGVAGVLVGVGPGAICTSREVLGIGVPQVTATIECAAARDAVLPRDRPLRPDHHRRRHAQRRRRLQGPRGRRRRRHARLCLRPHRRSARRTATPGACRTGHAELPRGVRITVGVDTTLDRLLFGPTSRTNGSENLVGAIRTCMGSLRRPDHLASSTTPRLVVAPSIKTEGKVYQLAR